MRVFKGTVLSSKLTDHPVELVLAISDNRTPEVTLQLVDSGFLKGAVPPGTVVEFSGVVTAFTPNPFMVTWEVHNRDAGSFKILTLTSVLSADLKRALAEPNLEKRCGLALANAAAAYEQARAAYERGDNPQVAASADEILESVRLAHTSLTATGKDPRESPKWFKRAEIDTRNLLRKLDSFQNGMSFSDRSVLDKARATVQLVHDDLLTGLLQGKKK